MRKFSIRPTFTLRGRKFKGLRGWSGKPAHPPLTDFPIAAYILAAVFDVVATVGRHESWARDFFHAGTFVFVGGAAVSVLAALTGFWDWLRSTEKGTQARRTANADASAMIVVTVLALANIALRVSDYDSRQLPDNCDPRHLDRRGAPRVDRRGTRRHSRVRLWIQRRDRGRQPGLASVRDGRSSRRPR